VALSQVYSLSTISRMAKAHNFRIIVGSTASVNIDPYACHVHAALRFVTPGSGRCKIALSKHLGRRCKF
jgi:hypothetical protein